MWGAETLKSSVSRRTGESRNASSGLRCASGRNAFLGHNLIALITFSLQSMWISNSNSSQEASVSADKLQVQALHVPWYGPWLSYVAH